MSIERRDGRYRVRWRHAGRHRSRTFDRLADARTFEADTRRRAALGDLAPIGDVTLAEWTREWWTHHGRTLAPATIDTYTRIWDRHVHPHLSGYPLRDLTVPVVHDWLTRLDARPPTKQKALTVLSSVLQLAVTHGMIPANPCRQVPAPRQEHASRVLAAPPAAVEQLRRELAPRDAALVSVLAYAGLRPQEALALRWRDVQSRLHVYSPKTRTHRTVEIMPALARDLREHRLAMGRPADHELVFPGIDWHNWRARTWAKPAQRAGIRRPYDLRHTFVSLLIADGRIVVDVAAQAGHSPQTCLRVYAHLFDDPPRTLAGAIERARVPDMYPERRGQVR